MNEEKKIDLLIEALKTFQKRFVDGAYSTMGIFLIVIGWLFTSDEARDYLVEKKSLILIVSLLIIFGYVAYVLGLFYIQGVSNKILKELQAKDPDKSYYEHYKISRKGVYYFAFMQLLPTILLLVTLCYLYIKE